MRVRFHTSKCKTYTYINRLLTFFIILGIEHPLCLLKVYGNIRMTEYGARRTKKGVPFGFRTSSNTSTSDKLYVTHANNLKTNAGLLKSSLHDGRYYLVFPEMIPGDIQLGDINI